MRFLTIFILILFISCSATRTFYILNKQYGENQQQEVLNDVKTTLKVLHVDSSVVWYERKGAIKQELYKQEFLILNDNKTKYFLIYTTFFTNDTTHYRLSVKCITSDKKIYNEYK